MNDNKRILFSVIVGMAVGLAAMLLTVSLALAAPLQQESEPEPTADARDCRSCHLDIADSWSSSAHAHAFDDPTFLERWHGMGDPGDCLACHTTNYQATTKSFDAEGVSCEACHGQVDPQHPAVPAPIRDDTEYCGTCHTTTLGEWRLTGHAHADVDCTDCHNPHSQKALFENPDEMCISCHQESMGPYLEDLHGKKGIGCVDCHALVIPPEVPPADGIVPTGHTFTITPATCVACHTDALHAGFSLPGYENGAKAAGNGETDVEATPAAVHNTAIVNSPSERIQMLESQVQVLTASNTNRSMTVLFQGGVVGLVLGGSTAWIIASNVRSARKEENEAAHEK